MAQKELDQIHNSFMNLRENSRMVSLALAYFDAYAMNLSDVDSYEDQEEFDHYMDNMKEMYAKFLKIRRQPSRN